MWLTATGGSVELQMCRRHWKKCQCSLLPLAAVQSKMLEALQVPLTTTGGSVELQCKTLENLQCRLLPLEAVQGDAGGPASAAHCHWMQW